MGSFAGSLVHWARSFSATSCAFALAALLALASNASAAPADIQAKFDAAAQAMKEGKAEQAAQLASEAFALAEQELGPDDPKTGVLAFNTGVLYARLGQWSQARGPLEKALANYEKAHGPTSVELLPPIDRLAQVYVGVQDAEAGVAVLERKLAIVSAVKGEKSREAALVMRDLSVAETGRGKSKVARRLQRRAADILEEDGKPSDELGQLYLAMSFTELSDTESGLAAFEAGAKYSRKARETIEGACEPGSPQRIQLYTRMIAGYKGFAARGPSGSASRRLEEYEEKLAEENKVAAEKSAAGVKPDCTPD